MEAVNNNLAQILVFLGLAILAVEVLILGFSTFVLFFLGLAGVLTGLLMFLGILPETTVSGLIAIAVLTAFIAVVLWKPLKKMQNNVVHSDAQNDLIGHSFVLEGDVSSTQDSTHEYSGIEWAIKSDEELAAGTEVKVVKTEVGVFTVAANV